MEQRARQEDTKGWYVADPVHQFVDFGDHRATVKALVSTHAFQRLRRISQLGLASYVFPGAVHTRFSHSLGAAHLAARLVKKLEVGKEDGRAIVCAALLHDVGHGPFSHSFERALKRVVPQRPKHEHWTRVIIQEVLADTLREHNVDPQHVCALIKGEEGDPKLPIFHRQIISSQLDVDRMDYLCRDAHFAGVPLGRVDLQYLLRNVCIVQHGSQRTLGLSSKGVACYEAFAFARHIMNRTVYFHKQVATFEAMMEECIRLLVEGRVVGFEPEVIRTLRAVKKGSPDKIQEVLFKPYLRVTEDQLWTAIDEAAGRKGLLGRLAKLLVERRPVPSYRVDSHKHAVLEEELKRREIPAEEAAVTTRPSSLYEQDSGEQVFVHQGNGVPAVHISNESSLVGALHDQTETEAVLVIFDESAEARILEVARAANCLAADQNPTPAKRPLAKGNAETPKDNASRQRKRQARANR